MFKHGDVITRRRLPIRLPLTTMLCPHLFTFVLGSRNDYSVYCDMSKITSGDVTKDWVFPSTVEQPYLFDDLGVLSVEVWSNAFATKNNKLVIGNVLVSNDIAVAK